MHRWFCRVGFSNQCLCPLWATVPPRRCPQCLQKTRFQDLLLEFAALLSAYNTDKSTLEGKSFCQLTGYSPSLTEILNILCFSPAVKYNSRLGLDPIISWHTGSWEESRIFFFFTLSVPWWSAIVLGLRTSTRENRESHWGCLTKAIVEIRCGFGKQLCDGRKDRVMSGKL